MNNCLVLSKFQFHKGTIKTRGYPEEQHQTRNFNSIKVRLKPSVIDKCRIC